MKHTKKTKFNQLSMPYVHFFRILYTQPVNVDDDSVCSGLEKAFAGVGV